MESGREHFSLWQRSRQGQVAEDQGSTVFSLGRASSCCIEALRVIVWAELWKGHGLWGLCAPTAQA